MRFHLSFVGMGTTGSALSYASLWFDEGFAAASGSAGKGFPEVHCIQVQLCFIAHALYNECQSGREGHRTHTWTPLIKTGKKLPKVNIGILKRVKDYRFTLSPW
jgi:hypothetical protein